MAITTEVAVFNIESALYAQKGGADRVELCDNPSEGGTTPSFGVMATVRQAISIDVYAMIRPRGGDFVYSAYEYHAMKRDIEMCKRASLDGVVFGILKPEGTIDRERSRKLIEAARPLKVTCHRAFDFTRDAYEALQDCQEAGFDRILTSGRQPSAAEGADVIKDLVLRAEGKISIIAGVGINQSNVIPVIKNTGVKEIHFSARTYKPSEYQRFNHLISLTESLPDDSGKWVADEEKIRRITELLRDRR
ncbi:MAG: copper homeostasis protein CutC [Flammeovirgaceae bacterium]|nr:MAG: copper homeostasis protein CutC [Flammeovirgaceae bacterium]